MSRAARSKIRLNRECLFATWGYVLTNFKTTLQTGTWEVVKKVAISLNSLKIKDQRVCFHKKFDNIPDYQILSFETLLYFQSRQTLSASVSFSCVFGSIYFWKIKWLVGGIECLTEVLETVLMEVYVHWAKFYPFFSCRLFCPGNSSIRSHNHNFYNFYWYAAIFLAFCDRLWQICAMI